RRRQACKIPGLQGFGTFAVEDLRVRDLEAREIEAGGSTGNPDRPRQEIGKASAQRVQRPAARGMALEVGAAKTMESPVPDQPGERRKVFVKRLDQPREVSVPVDPD